jgi:hypothetical protein
MSRFTEIQNQYQGYVAASKAVEKTRPGRVEAVYKESNDNNSGNDGIFVYYPETDIIEIAPRRCMGSDFVHIKADDVPALIKALREFFE